MDKKRKNSPLIKVKDAILIETDKLNKMPKNKFANNNIETILNPSGWSLYAGPKNPKIKS